MVDALEIEHEKEETETIAIPPQEIDKSLLESSLEEWKNSYVIGKLNLKAAIENAVIEIQKNICIIKVAHAVARLQILEHKDNLLQHLRKNCKNPTLVIEIVIEESLDQSLNTGLPLTNEEKRKQMEQANPHLLLLQQKFNTILVY